MGQKQDGSRCFLGCDAVVTLKELLETQYRQQQVLLGDVPGDSVECSDLAWRLATQLVDEAFEYLNAAGYKLLGTDPAPRTTRVLELVDVFKYLLSLCWIEGVTAEEFSDLFYSKTDVVYQRHKALAETTHMCGFDVDGVLANFDRVDYYRLSEEERDAWWDSGRLSQLEMCEGASQVLHQLKEDGWTIIIITARKVWRHNRLEYETHNWLRKHDIPYDRLLFGPDKTEVVSRYNLNLSFFVEDNSKHALDFAMAGIPVMLIRHPEVQHNLIAHIKNISDVKLLANVMMVGV